MLRETGQAEEAERCFRRVAELEPKDADALFHLGSLLDERGEHAEAVRLFRHALAAAPDHPFLWLHLGIACRKLGDTDAAAAAYGRLLELRPDDAEAHNNLANLLQEEGRLDEALAHYREAVRIEPRFALAWNNLGSALVRTADLAGAAAALRRALELQPDLAEAHFNLGNVHGLEGEHDAAVRNFSAAHALRPAHPAYGGRLLFEMQQVCDWSRFDELCAARLRAPAAGVESGGTPFSLLTIPSTPAAQLECARAYAREQERPLASARARLDFRHARRSRPRIRIGYLSADFHSHATAYLAAGLFELHDRKRFEIVAYSWGPDDASPLRNRVMRAFDRFVELGGVSDAEAAKRIHADEVDILVDLKGYTTHARPGIVALRPAPVQASYLGYPGTMGADFIDYLIADRTVVPPEEARYYSETLALLPGSYQVNDRSRRAAGARSRGELGLPEDAFVFCCFNQAYKILPSVFEVWTRLLGALPQSVLWLLESNAWARQNLIREAGRRGIAGDRLRFAPFVATEENLARLSRGDLFLDTSPYNAHTSASDALWAGLPVVTCAGSTFASRVAASLLHAVGVPELVCSSPAEYESLALRLATSPEELRRLRDRLTGNHAAKPLFDTPAFVRNIEAAYQAMWRKFLSGEAREMILL